MTAVESAQLLESGLYCCCKCKGMFSCQDDRLKHQINCIGNPFKTTCSYFACERKIFLQLFQPEDFLLDGCEQPFIFSKDDSFINHFVKIRVPDIFDPSIFLKSTPQTNTVDTDDSNFLLESNINTLEEEAEKTSCSTFLESDKQVDSSEDDQIQNIINKNIEYLKNNDLPNLNTGTSKVPSFQSSPSLPRLLSPVDRHLHLFGDGNKSRIHSPFERSSSSSYLQDGQMGYNFMYSSNPSIPFSCNFSTDLFSSIPPPSQDDNQAFLTNIEECPTLRYLDLARKDPFFGQNPGLPQVNTKDPFLINATVKTAERPTPTLQKSHITRSCEDIQASPTLQLQDGNYFNFPSTLDEPTQLDYLDLATLDFITNPNLIPTVPVLYKEKSAEKDDDIYRVADLACEEQISKTESGSKVLSMPAGSNSYNDNAGKIKNKKLRLKKSKSDVERRQYVSVLPPDQDLTGNLTVLKEDFLKENFDLVDDVVAKCNERPLSETKDYRICRKRKLDSSKANGSGEVKPTKTHKRSGDTRRMSKTDIVFNPRENLTNIPDESKDSMNDVLGETGCIYVKKKRSLSCDEPVVYVNEANVFGDTRSFYDNSRPNRPNRVRTKSNSYITGLSNVGNLESSPNKAQRLTSIIKLRCPNCSFSCQSVAELKSHCIVHEGANTSMSNDTAGSTADKRDVTKIHDGLGSILSINDSLVPNSEGKMSGSLLYSVNNSTPHFSGHVFSNISSESSVVNMQSQTVKTVPNSISSFRVIEPPRVKTDIVNKTSHILASFNVDNVVSDQDIETELAVRAIANVAGNESFELLGENGTLERTNSVISTSSNNLYEFGKATHHLGIHPSNCEQIKDDFGDTSSLNTTDNSKYDTNPENSQQDIVQESNQFEHLDLNADLSVASLSLYSLQEIRSNVQSSNIEVSGNKSAGAECNNVRSQLDETFRSHDHCKNDIHPNDRNLFENFKVTGISETEQIDYAVVSKTENFLLKDSSVDTTCPNGMSGEDIKESDSVTKQATEVNESTEVDMNKLLADVGSASKKSGLNELECIADSDKIGKEYDEMCIDSEIVSEETNVVTDSATIIKLFIDDFTDNEKFVSDKKILVEDPLVTNCDVAIDSKSVRVDSVKPTKINENLLTNEFSETIKEQDTLSSNDSCEMVISNNCSDTKMNEEQAPPTDDLLTTDDSSTLYIHHSKLVDVGPDSTPKRVVQIIKLQTDKPNTVDVVKSLNQAKKCSESDHKSSIVEIPTKCSTSMYNNVKNQPTSSTEDKKASAKYYFCEEKGCSFKSIYKKNLTTHHKQIHLCEQKYLCDQCAYSTPHLSSLKHHIQLKHLHEKRFKCPNCDYLSKFRLDVVKHVRHTHMKQKQFACNQCEYRAGHSHSLKLHLMSHAGICSFKCSGCDYRVGSTDKVARHIKFKHANQTDVKCEKLDVTFKFDPKQFLCDGKVPNDNIQVIELSPEEAKILTEKQLKEKELKSKVPEKKPKPKKSNDGFEMFTDEVNRVIVMKRIVPN